MREKKPPYVVPDDYKERYPHLQEFFPFLHNLNFESARGAIMIGCSYIDDLLAQAIRNFLVPDSGAKKLLDGFNAPLGTFSARIVMAYSLGILHKVEFEEVERLRKIRNALAHSKTAEMTDQDISAWCKALTFAAPGDNPESRMRSSVVALITWLVNRPAHVKREQLPGRIWPM